MDKNQENKPQASEAGTSMRWRMGSMIPWIEAKAGRPVKKADKIIGILLIVIFLFVFYVVLDANKYRMQVLVIEGEGKVGVNPTTELLDFGDMSKGTTAIRTVTLNNGTFMPMYVMIFKTGGLGELVDVNNEATGEESRFFKLKPKEEVKVNFSATMPASVQVDKKYTGRVFIFKVPTFGI